MEMSRGIDPEAERTFVAAFSHLPWVQREVFRLHSSEGYAYAEIAWLLGVSERFVERQMAKAIYKLAKQMDAETLHWWERWF
jgi:RNA polymerase sigma factor (sigma-70 family)